MPSAISWRLRSKLPRLVYLNLTLNFNTLIKWTRMYLRFKIKTSNRCLMRIKNMSGKINILGIKLIKTRSNNQRDLNWAISAIMNSLQGTKIIKVNIAPMSIIEINSSSLRNMNHTKLKASQYNIQLPISKIKSQTVMKNALWSTYPPIVSDTSTNFPSSRRTTILSQNKTTPE